jgi:hypothetical protein
VYSHQIKIRLAREWYRWVGLSKDTPRYKFRFLNFDLEFLKGVQSFKVLTAKICPIYQWQIRELQLVLIRDRL